MIVSFFACIECTTGIEALVLRETSGPHRCDGAHSMGSHELDTTLLLTEYTQQPSSSVMMPKPHASRSSTIFCDYHTDPGPKAPPAGTSGTSASALAGAASISIHLPHRVHRLRAPATQSASRCVALLAPMHSSSQPYATGRSYPCSGDDGRRACSSWGSSKFC